MAGGDTTSDIDRSSRCPLHSKPHFLDSPTPNKWQVVQERTYYVYSAHADPRMGNVTLIRLFGIMPLDRSDGAYQGETFWCQVWINAHGKPHIAEAFLYNQGRAKEKWVISFAHMTRTRALTCAFMNISVVTLSSCENRVRVMGQFKPYSRTQMKKQK